MRNAVKTPRRTRAPPREPPIIAAWCEGGSEVYDEAAEDESVGDPVTELEDGMGKAVANAPCPDSAGESEGADVPVTTFAADTN